MRKVYISREYNNGHIVCTGVGSQSGEECGWPNNSKLASITIDFIKH
jgi:hypothetical protein